MTDSLSGAEWVLSLSGFTKKRGFQDTKRVFALLKEKGLIYLDTPASKVKILHVAGTNGKGSVCAAVDSILRSCGHTTGLFTSPHLIDIRERMRFCGEMISAEDFSRLTEVLKAVLPSFDRDDLGYFEALFLIAMLWYSEKEPDFLILETGLGGRLDATNAIEKPALCVITRIGLDHTALLGETIREIAREKAGIIKSQAPVIFLAEPNEAAEEIVQIAQAKSSPAWPVSVNNSLDFSHHFLYDKHIRFSLPKEPFYQRENFPLALAAAEYLAGFVDREAFQKGLDQFSWPARFEEIIPGIIIDGAHNPDGMKAFLRSVQEDGCRDERILVLAMKQGKDYETSCRMIGGSGLFSQIYCAGERAKGFTDAEALASCFMGVCGINLKLFSEPREAYAEAVKEKRKEGLVYITGSLYLYEKICKHE